MKKLLFALVPLLFTAGYLVSAEINDLEPVDASNTGRFPESMPLSDVNNGARALEGIVSRWDIDTGTRVLAGGSATAFTVAASQTITSYYDGLVIGFTSSTTNTGTQTSLNVDSVAAATVYKTTTSGIIPVAANELPLGAKVVVAYDQDNSRWLVIGGPTASTTGLLQASNNLSDVDSAASARGNLAVAASVITTQGDIIRGSSAADYERLALGSTGEILTSDGTDVAWAATSTVIQEQTFPSSFTSGATTITTAASVTFAHTLAATPTLFQTSLINATPEGAYVANEEVFIPINSHTSTSGYGVTITADATSIYVRYGDQAKVFLTLNKSTGATINLTNASWLFRVRAW